MKHGYLWRGIAATTVLGIILLPGSFVVRADGQGGERKNVRGDGNPDEIRQLLPTTRADHPDITAAEGGGNVRGGGQIPRGAGSESVLVSDTKHNTEKGRHLKKKDKKKQLFTPPGREDEGEEPADNFLFVDTKTAKSEKAKSDPGGNGGEKLKKAKGEKVKDSYMVVFDAAIRDADMDWKAQEYTKKAGGKMKGKSLPLIHGFAVEMTEAEAVAMSLRSDVKVRGLLLGHCGIHVCFFLPVWQSLWCHNHMSIHVLHVRGE